jgi:hypothetical protein
MSQENSFAKNLLAQRGRRAAATLLTWLEDNIQHNLTTEEWEETRSKVLYVLGEFQDLAMDMVTSDTGVINDYWVQALTEIRDRLRSIDGHNKIPADR